MKIFADINILARFTQYKLSSVLKYIQDSLQSLDVTDVEGEQLKTLSAQNIVMDGLGNGTITVDTLDPSIIGFVPTEAVAPDSPTGGVRLYAILNATSVELHALFPNDTDKTITTDVI